MSGLICACIAPHGSMVVPLLAGGEGQKVLATRAAMEELGRRMAATHPETVVVMTPHGHRIDGAFSLLNNQRVRGELGPEEDGNPHSFTLGFEVDKDLNAAILDASRSLEVPVSRIGYPLPYDPGDFQQLTWGVTVPLWFLVVMFFLQLSERI